MVVWRGCVWEYGRINGHGRLRSVWRKSPEGLVVEERLDLLPRERGGGVGCSGVSARGPRLEQAALGRQRWSTQAVEVEGR